MIIRLPDSGNQYHVEVTQRIPVLAFAVRSNLFVVFAQSPSSTTPPIEISSSRLTKLTRRTTDRKSEFLKTLKDDRNGDFSENRDCDKLEDVRA